jgi:hypothetical protein
MNWFHIERSLFPGQQPDEKIYLILRQHWFTLASKMAIWFIFVIIFALIDFLVSNYLPMLLVSPYIEIINLIKSVYLMFIILGLLLIWVMYYLNVQVVTNERVVDITQSGILHHTISELHLSRIQDVTADIEGLFHTFLNYGNVYLQTAGETERFVFSEVPNPVKVEKLILDLYEQLPPEKKFQSGLGKK